MQMLKKGVKTRRSSVFYSDISVPEHRASATALCIELTVRGGCEA